MYILIGILTVTVAVLSISAVTMHCHIHDLEHRFDPVECKAKFVADQLGYKEGWAKDDADNDYYGSLFGFQRRRTLIKWDALICKLNLEWEEKTNHVAIYKKKPK